MKAQIFLMVFIPVLCCFGSCKSQSETVNANTSDETVAKAPDLGNQISQGDNSKTSVDWPGIYFGNLPCADCEGIQTRIELKKDLTYTMQTKYTGKTGKVNYWEGTFSWNNQGSMITLKDGKSNNTVMYQVGENVLFQLDQQGNRIAGASADRYKLFKTDGSITEKYWRLTELNGKKVMLDATSQKEVHLILKSQENRVKGYGGCNSFFGNYALKPGNRIAFSEIGSTQMACPNMETESQFFKALQAADNYVLNGDTLLLNKAKMAPLARFEVVYFR